MLTYYYFFSYKYIYRIGLLGKWVCVCVCMRIHTIITKKHMTILPYHNTKNVHFHCKKQRIPSPISSTLSSSRVLAMTLTFS